MYESYICVPVRTELFVGLVAFLHEADRADDPVELIEAAIRALIDRGDGDAGRACCRRRPRCHRRRSDAAMSGRACTCRTAPSCA